MRQPRFLVSVDEADGGSGIYHCVSRVVHAQDKLATDDGQKFVQLMRLYERFCEVRVLAYAVMPDHIRLLIEVPPRRGEDLSDRDFLAKLSMLYDREFVEEIRGELRERKRAGDDAGVRALKEKYLYRMWSLSQFMKTLKQRFTQWFNRTHERRGTLWEARFKSVIVEDGLAALVLAAYLDLSPVRDGLADDPGDYRACSFSEAVAGGKDARAGIERVVKAGAPGNGSGKELRTWRQVIAEYRKFLGLGEDWKVDREALPERLKAGEKLPMGELLRCNVRYFDDGAVIGSREFVDRVWAANRERFGPKRKSGARPIRESAEPLFSLRALQTRAIE